MRVSVLIGVSSFECSVGQLPCPRVLGERLTDLVVVGRVRDVDLGGGVDQDGAHLVADELRLRTYVNDELRQDVNA